MNIDLFVLLFVRFPGGPCWQTQAVQTLHRGLIWQLWCFQVWISHTLVVSHFCATNTAVGRKLRQQSLIIVVLFFRIVEKKWQSDNKWQSFVYLLGLPTSPSFSWKGLEEKDNRRCNTVLWSENSCLIVTPVESQGSHCLSSTLQLFCPTLLCCHVHFNSGAIRKEDRCVLLPLCVCVHAGECVCVKQGERESWDQRAGE